MATQSSLFSSAATALAIPIPLIPGGNCEGGVPPAPPSLVPIHDPGMDLARKTDCIKVRLSTMGNCSFRKPRNY